MSTSNVNANGNINTNANGNTVPTLKPVTSGPRIGSIANAQSYNDLHPISMMGTGSLKDVRSGTMSGFGNRSNHGSVRGTDSVSDYADSEYADTIVTDLESLNSISDDEMEANEDARNKIQHLQLPVNGYE